MKSPIDYLKRLMRSQRGWRYFLIAVAVTPLILVLPHARSLVLRNAVTTAYLSVVRAPISGQILEISVKDGSVTQEGEPLVTIRNDQVDRGGVARLEVLRDSLREEVAQLRGQLDSVRTLAETRNLEYLSNVSSVTQDLVSQLQTVRDRVKARSAALREAEGNLQRVRQLFDNGLLSASDVETAEAVYENAQAEYSASDLERVRLAERLDETERGVFQVDIPEGVLLTRQAAQELQLEVLKLERALAESEANLEATTAEASAARAAYDAQANVEVTLPAGKTIWNVHASAGTWTTEGTSLIHFVDCSRLMVDIAVDDATLELIEPGHPIRVRLFGSFTYRSGKIVLVRGSGATVDPLDLAAEVQDRGTRSGQVLALLDPSELSGKPESSCGIGRTAYAEFEDINLFELLILPLFR